MKPRVLHVIGALVSGGAETQLKLLAQGLDGLGWPTGVAYLKDDPNFTDRGTITCLPIERGPKKDLLGLAKRIGQAIDQFQPDIVHTWLPEIVTLPAAWHARRRGIPCVSAQRCSLRHTFALKDRLRDTLIPANHLLADRVVCNFDFQEEPALTRRIIQDRQGVTIRNGFRLSAKAPAARPDWLRPEAFKVLYVGRLVPQKRVDLVLKAVAALRAEGQDLQLAICGEGVLGPALQAEAGELGLRVGEDVRFLGYQPDWQSLAGHFDLFALPTLAEGMPNVLVEAMGRGLPALTTNIFEIRSFVNHDEHAWLVPPGSAEAFTAGLRELVRAPEKRRQLALAGCQLAQQLSPENMVLAYTHLYQEMLRVPPNKCRVCAQDM